MKQITLIVLGAAFVFLIGYDMFAIGKGGTEASISSMIINFSYKMPMFTFGFGFICGHLFWRMRSNKDTQKIDKGE
jgi:predicted tellurium resistance membrane protein TerC